MAPIKLTEGVLDYDTIKGKLINNPLTGEEIGFCTHPAGHCFGSDGGTGIPENLKVAPGRGGEFEVWKLSATKLSILAKYRVEKCQYCLKYYVSEEIKEE